MRLSLAADPRTCGRLFLLTLALLLLSAPLARAQYETPPANQPAQAQNTSQETGPLPEDAPPADQAAAPLPEQPPATQQQPAAGLLNPVQSLPGAARMQGALPQAAQQALMQQEEQPVLNAKQQDKVNQLAKQAQQQREEAAQISKLEKRDDVLDQSLPPPEVDALQRVNETYAKGGNNIADDPVSKEMGLDMRKESQREAALSYGARGGLAKRSYQIMERMRGFNPVLDRVFNFRQLLIKTPSGLLIEPPIVKESIDAMVINDDGGEAAVADKVFDINKQAKIVSAPRDWRQYLIQAWSDVPPPPRALWPKTPQEQADWNSWVATGWKAGYEQAEQIFESNVNRLLADYNGMVRYRMLLAQGMISEPYALHEDRGVTGDKNQMRVGDRALRITGPSQFLTGADLWKPADR